jgi:cell division septation protein DedD
MTDANGLYTFRDLTPGDYRIVATHHGREYVASVSVPNGPAIVRDVDVAVLPDPVVPGPSAPRAAAIPSRPTTKPNEGVGPSGGEQKVKRATSKAAASSLAGPTFTIQVAASPNERYAREMVDELKRAGHKAYLVEGTASGVRGVYRVRVGHYSTRSEANRSALTLEKALGWRLWVTTVDQGSLRASTYASR